MHPLRNHSFDHQKRDFSVSHFYVFGGTELIQNFSFFFLNVTSSQRVRTTSPSAILPGSSDDAFAAMPTTSSPRRAHRADAHLRNGAWLGWSPFRLFPKQIFMLVPSEFDINLLPPPLCAVPASLAAGRSGGWAGVLLATCAVLLASCSRTEAQPQLREVRELSPSLPSLLSYFFTIRHASVACCSISSIRRFSAKKNASCVCSL